MSPVQAVRTITRGGGSYYIRQVLNLPKVDENGNYDVEVLAARRMRASLIREWKYANKAQARVYVAETRNPPCPRTTSEQST